MASGTESRVGKSLMRPLKKSLMIYLGMKMEWLMMVKPEGGHGGGWEAGGWELGRAAAPQEALW